MPWISRNRRIETVGKGNDSLGYPVHDVPEGTSAVEVHEGVLWIRLPLPFELNHVNVFALREVDGW